MPIPINSMGRSVPASSSRRSTSASAVAIVWFSTLTVKTRWHWILLSVGQEAGGATLAAQGWAGSSAGGT